ncbi:hypothetical protein ACQ4LE_009009 [Meloidogyne hapla]
MITNSKEIINLILTEIMPFTTESAKQMTIKRKEAKEKRRLRAKEAAKARLSEPKIKKEDKIKNIKPEASSSNKMDFRGKIITSRLIWLDESFQENVFIKIDKEGKIEEIMKKDEKMNERKIENFGEIALLPGFVNAHSHAFHRELRGLSQIGNIGADNFWKWRQNMYKLVEDIDYEKLKKICINTFSEMLSAGITAVGEFHYVHHSNKFPDGQFGLDMAVVEAAYEVGIRLVFIETLYMRAGFSQSDINPEQWRFASKTVDQFIEYVDGLRGELKNFKNCNDLVTIALAVHSLRAVPVPEARKLYQYALQNNLPLHLHLEEQPAELENCRVVHKGKDPGDVLLEDVLENEGAERINNSLITAVHCTHSKRSNLDEFVKRKINVCVCPCTEGYLGDGIPNLNEFDNICLGTDCNNRIAMLEEMRWLAFCQNMRTNSRNCASLNAQKLFKCATINGAKSLGISSKIGDCCVGKQFDFFGINLNSNKLKEFCDGERLLDSLIFGGGNDEILMTGIGGIVKFNKN